MVRRGAALVILCSCLWLGACRESIELPSAAPAAASATNTSHNVTIKGRIHADLTEMTFTLVGDSAPESDGVLRVRAIEIRRGTEAEPWQRIGGLVTETPSSVAAPGLELLDMNFDGYADIHLVEARPAGPNVPYLNWLYDPASGRFVENRALNAIASPRFDAQKREVRSDWRDGAARYGTDIYVFRDGQPVPVRREANEYKRPGVYALQVSRWVDGAWQVVETRERRDP
jgi:hypothetical protein